MFERKNLNDVIKLTPVAEKKLLNLLDFDVYHRLPTCSSTGVQLFDNTMLIIPTNFRILSYLNLEEVYYTENCLNLVHFMNSDILLWSRYFGIYDFIAKSAGCVFEHSIKDAISKDFIANPEILPRFTRKLLRNFKRYSINKNTWEIKLFFFSVMKLLFNFDCKDSTRVVEVLNTVCRTQSVKEHILNGVIKPNLVDYILKHCIYETFNIWNFLNGIHFCPVVESIYRGRLLHLEVLLCYGFKRDEQNASLRCLLYNRYGSDEMIDSGISLGVRKLVDHNADIRRYVLNYDLLFLVCKVLCNLAFRYQWIHCGYLLFRSIPDPYISLKEFKAILPLLVDKTDNQIPLSMICDAHKVFFSDITIETSSPRKLMHLCRCTIRESLRQNFQLPFGIEKLNLPKTMVSYLKLEW